LGSYVKNAKKCPLREICADWQLRKSNSGICLT
jgi:hypothetical protein